MLRFLLLVVLASSSTALPAQDRPNIVWLVSEDNSPYLGAYGDSLVHTPTLDRLAAEGIRYTHAFANAPVCAPSRSTLITGMYPPTLGSQHMRSNVAIAEHQRFFPQYLRAAGYFTTLRLKRDYNIPDQPGTWDLDEWWNIADAFAGREPGQPFFLFYNTWMSHEGELHDFEEKQRRYFRTTFERFDSLTVDSLLATVVPIDPAAVRVPAYLPDLPVVRRDLARYYEIMQLLDLEFAAVLRDLEQHGELDNTIVIYSSDHGGVLGRSKRFAFESGLHVPLIVRFPEKYRHLAPAGPGSTEHRLVSFVDMAPTILRLAGVEVPPHFQGRPFLGSDLPPAPDYVFGFRGRMDETYDMVRTLRDHDFRYVRNYNPHRPTLQRVNFLWRAPNLPAWEAAYRAGNLSPVQAAPFEPRVAEELYAIATDPDNVRNLAADPAYAPVLQRMRQALQDSLRHYHDTGFVPEGELFARYEATGQLYQDYVQTLPLDNNIAAAETATRQPAPALLASYLRSPIAAIRYWGATGALLLPQSDPALAVLLRRALDDPSGDVRVVAAETLYRWGVQPVAITAFERALADDNPFVVLRAANALEATGATSELIEARVAEIAEREPQGRFNYATRKCQYLVERSR